MIVLHQNDGMADIFHLFEQRVGEFSVDFLIVLPIAGTEKRARVRDVAQRPQPFVGEPVVIALLFFLR